MRIPSSLAKLYGRETLQKMGAQIMAGGPKAFERNRRREAELTGTLEALAVDMNREPRARGTRGPRTTNPDKSPIRDQQAPTSAPDADVAPAATKAPTATPKPHTRQRTAEQLQETKEARVYSSLWVGEPEGHAELSREDSSLHARLSPAAPTESSALTATDQGVWSKLFGKEASARPTAEEEALYSKAYVKGSG